MAKLSEVSFQLRKKHKQYIEATYHIHDEDLIKKRGEIIDKETSSSIWIEKTPRYVIGKNILELELPKSVMAILDNMAKKEGSGVFESPYSHQSKALISFFSGHNIVVSTGTGSGKTEIFLYSLLGLFSQEGERNRGKQPQRGIRAIILYPMNSLVSDQMSRMRKMFGREPGKDELKKQFGRTVQFGMYTSRTPYFGNQDSNKDKTKIRPIIKYYVDMKNNQSQTFKSLDDMGKVPAKDLDSYLKTYQTSDGDAELFSRQEMYSPNENGGTPDILITNYSMMEYILLRAVEEPLLIDTAKWLKNTNNKLTIVIDEAHLYYGSQGAEISMLIGRLLMKLGITVDRVNFILTSASLGGEETTDEEIKKFASDLTGSPNTSFEIIKGEKERTNIDGSEEIRAEDLYTLISAGDLSRIEKTRFFKELLSMLDDRSISVDKIGKKLFPKLSPENATALSIKMIDSALDIRNKNGDPKYPLKMHIVFRGMDSQYLCINPKCNKLFMGVRERCDVCGGRTFELYTHRTCGAAFIRGYVTQNASTLDNYFMWNRKFGDSRINNNSEDVILALEANDDSLVDKRYIDPFTGFVSKKDRGEWRQVYSPYKNNIVKDSRNWKKCPICGAKGDKKIMDLETKGEDVFSNLIKSVFESQDDVIGNDYPNKGKKVLCFSDSRKKAAKLARDIQRNIEQDAFKETLVAAYCTYDCRNLSEIFNAFTKYCSEHNISFFDDGNESEKSSRSLFEKSKSVISKGDSVSITEIYSIHQYCFRLLKALGDENYSLTASLVAVVEPTIDSQNRIISKLGDKFTKDEITAIILCSIWNALLERALDKDIDVKDRKESRKTTNWDGSQKNEGLALKEIIPERIYKIYQKPTEYWGELEVEIANTIFSQSLQDDFYYIRPDSVTLNFDNTWYRCNKCWQFYPYNTASRCIKCLGDLLPCTPDDPHLKARKSLLREPYESIINRSRIPYNIRSEEHSAQLSRRDSDSINSKTEEYELLFQDIILDEGTESPIDVLSCTTTMEVGIDIGSLTSVALRTVPPRSDNYQQRAGRAGRRKGSNLSTIITYADNKPYELHGFKNPDIFINGRGKTPILYSGNEKICKRHINAALLNIFFFDECGRTGDGGVFQSMDKCQVFFNDISEAGISTFESWVKKLDQQSDVVCKLGKLLPDDLRRTSVTTTEKWREEYILRKSKELLNDLLEIKNIESYSPDEELIVRLLNAGILPSFSFPLDIGRFVVYKSKAGEPSKFQYDIQESLKQALNDYIPGQEVVVDKKTYRCGGLVFPYASGTDQARDNLDTLKKEYIKVCNNCDSLIYDENEKMCSLCGKELRLVTMLRPETFAPPRGGISMDASKYEEHEMASAAALPVKKGQLIPEEDKKIVDRIEVERGYNQTLKIINYGLKKEGFSICRACGKIDYTCNHLNEDHLRPYPYYNHQCQESKTMDVVLGYDLITDLITFRICNIGRIDTIALRSAAISLKEGMIIAASELLNIDTKEISGGYRILMAGESPVLEIFLYDTTPSGAGFSSSLFNVVNKMLDHAALLLKECSCDSSCQSCLRTYDNRINHDVLDRNLAINLLTFARTGIVPEIDEKRMNEYYELLSRAIKNRIPESNSEIKDNQLLIKNNANKTSILIHSFLLDSHVEADVLVTDYDIKRNLPLIVEDIREKLRR